MTNTWCGCDIVATLKESDMLYEMAGGSFHELTENKRSDATIFDFISSLRVDEPDEMDQTQREPSQEHEEGSFPCLS